MTRKIKYDRHDKINVKQQLGFPQDCKRTKHKRRSQQHVDFLWQRQIMSIAPLFVATQNTTESSYAQIQDACNFNKLQKSISR